MTRIRPFRPSDAPRLWTLKFQTIRQFCIKDYSETQVAAWAPNAAAPVDWPQRIARINPYIALHNNAIVGFADLQKDGYIDHFFCDHNHIGQGVGSELMRHILSHAEQRDINKLYSHVSITAKPFFERFGFRVVRPQQVDVGGTILKNYIMELQQGLARSEQ